MSTETARELRRSPPLDDARALVAALGMGERAQRAARGLLICCPAHADRSPSCSVFAAEDGTVAVKCHACGWSADALGLIAIARGLDVRRDFRRVLDEAVRLTGCDPVASPRRGRDPHPAVVSDETYHAISTHLLDFCSPLRECPDVAAYLDGRRIYADADAARVRGLPRDCGALVASLLATFERADLERAGVLRRGQDAIDWPAWSLCIPWRDRFGRVTCIQRRRLDDTRRDKYRFPPDRAPRAPFGVDLLVPTLDALGAQGEVAFVEGALDALARRRIARHRGERCAVLGIPSASSACVGLPLDLLEGRRVLLACDDDEAGWRACDALADALYGVALERDPPPPGCKDWGAALTEAV